MFKEYISDEHMINMAAEAARSMDPELYELGKDYYNRGRVEWTKLFGPRIYSVVDDGKKNTVIIHIDNFSKSTCACVKKHFCEHIAAVFLHYYEPWLMEKESLPNINLPPSGKKAFNPKPPPRLKKQALIIPVTEEGPAERWHEYFEREYGRLVVATEKDYRQYVANQLDEMCYPAMKFNDFITAVSVHSKNWPSFNRSLYRLHSILFFMTRLEKSVKKESLSFLGSFQISRIEVGLMDALNPVMSLKRREHYRPFIQKAVELVRENFLREKEQLFAWISIYRLMCVTLLDSREWLESETACLKEKMKGLKENGQGYYYTVLGLAGLLMSANRSGDALAILQKLKEKNIEDMFFYLHELAGAKKWGKLLPWIRWLDDEIRDANPALFEDVCEYCILAAKNSRFGEEFAKLVKSWLPDSFYFYADYLLAAGMFREWVELNIIYHAHGRQSINTSALRHLESSEPALLIPLYHQWAARLIEDKNRSSYREAVRLLKKLRSLYNSQKMGKEWERFISRLSLRYSRMRAFQEELRKGKLIS